MSNSRLFAVAGSPIFKSKSPSIWNRAFDMLDLDAVYFRMSTDNLAEAVNIAKEIGVKGLNITAPYKEESLKFANDVSKEVNEIGAANCFLFDEGKVNALNTDHLAVERILLTRGVTSLSDKKVLVIGAGGAARAALYLLKKMKANITITNRTEQKAKKIASIFNITHKTFLGSMKQKYDIVINCIPHSNDVLNSVDTELLIDASYNGHLATSKYVPGEEWLVLQAEAFFKHFFDADPLVYMKDVVNIPIMPKEHIALIGFMGSGKTVIGKLLAKELGYDLIDMDELIEKKTGMNIVEIFNSKGQECFRELEKDLLLELELERPTVVATGGGIVLDPKNIAYIKKLFNVVWLWTDITTIRSRINTVERPLFKDNVVELLKHRTPLYAEASDFCISNCHKAPRETIAKIISELN